MRGIQWLTKLILSALITSAVCIASTFWVIQTYVDIVLEQYQLKPMVQSTPSWSQLVGRLTQQLSLSGSSSKIDSSSVALGDKKQPPADQPVSGSISGSGGASDAQPGGALNGATGGAASGAGGTDTGVSGTGPQGTGASSGASATGTGTSGAGGTGSGSPAAPSVKDGTSADKNPPEDAIAVFGHQSGQSGAGAAGSSGSGLSGSEASDADRRVVVSGEDFTKKKEQLSNEDKNKIFNLLVSRIPQDEMQRISRLMEDGITASELKEIEQVLQKYLKQDEYNQLLGMIKTN